MTHGSWQCRWQPTRCQGRLARSCWQSLSFVEQAGYDRDRVLIDPSVVRGLEYYTGPVFEVELTFSTDSKDGSPRFGSVGGGGRYDGLVVALSR